MSVNTRLRQVVKTPANVWFIIRNEQVTGSNPAIGSSVIKVLRGIGGLFFAFFACVKMAFIVSAVTCSAVFNR